MLEREVRGGFLQGEFEVGLHQGLDNFNYRVTKTKKTRCLNRGGYYVSVNVGDHHWVLGEPSHLVHLPQEHVDGVIHARVVLADPSQLFQSQAVQLLVHVQSPLEELLLGIQVAQFLF